MSKKHVLKLILEKNFIYFYYEFVLFRPLSIIHCHSSLSTQTTIAS